MHSSLVRLQTVFGFFTTVSFFVAALVALSSTLYPGDPSGSVKIKSTQIVKGKQNYYSTKQQEYAFIKFDLDADLTSLFNWNTKQVFTYLTVSYPGGSTSKGISYTNNTSVIWDRIIPHKGKAKLGLRTQRAKYNVNDITGRFEEREATLKLHYNVQPHVGQLVWGEVPLAEVPKLTFPAVAPRKRTAV